MVIQFLQESPTIDILDKVSKRKLIFETDGSESLENKEIEETVDLLKGLVKRGTFSTNNIAFKLFQDTLKWHSCSNTSGMRYSEEKIIR